MIPVFPNHTHRDLESSDGIASFYGLDYPGIESRWERDFPNSRRLTLWPMQPGMQRAPGPSSSDRAVRVLLKCRDVPLLASGPS
jgi:hypothetical protein